VTDPLDPLRNPLDPLHQSGPDPARELFRQLGRLSTGKPYDDVVNAACALLINAIRQQAVDWRRAESVFDEYFARSKQLLKDHYDANGRKRGIFPYDQGIAAPFLFDKDKFPH
jgi:hypothetical protein